MCSIVSQGSAFEISIDSTCARHFLSKFSMCFDFHSCFALCQILSFIKSLHVGASRAATGVHDGKALLASWARRRTLIRRGEWQCKRVEAYPINPPILISAKQQSCSLLNLPLYKSIQRVVNGQSWPISASSVADPIVRHHYLILA